MSTDWIPSELMSVGKRTMVRWIHPGAQPLFQDPFFSQSVDALVSANSPQKLTPLDELVKLQAVKAPRGFIFHVSRCGSTLVSRSLAAVPSHRVIAEASPVNQLLLAEDLDPQLKAQLLKGLIHALCGSSAETACVFKFTSWNLLFLKQILVLFPATPWVFIYREPADVMRSLTARPPRWAGNQMLARSAGNTQPERLSQTVQLLESMFKAPLPHVTRLMLAVNYSQLPDAIFDIAAHFNLDLDAAQRGQVLRMAQYDSKQAGEIVFRPREHKPLVAEMHDDISQLIELYQQWDQIGKEAKRHVEQ